MDIVIHPALLAGSVTPPPSKSQAHRAVLGRMLAGGGEISNLQPSQDILATERCCAALQDSGTELPVLDCGESGSTLRFLIPMALALHGGGVFVGHGRLMERPLDPYFSIFDQQSIAWEKTGNTLRLKGELKAGDISLPGNISSQFITGLLFALPLLEGDSRIMLTTPLESKGYVDMTLEVLGQFGIAVENREYQEFLIPGNQHYGIHDIANSAVPPAPNADPVPCR